MKYFLGFLITIGLIIMLVFLIFRGGDNREGPVAAKSLSSYASTDAAISMAIDGPILAEQDHNRIRITVDRNSVTFQQIRGYENDVVNQQVVPNTQAAYTNFLLALGRAGFTLNNRDNKLGDERGRCPLGARYVFDLQQGGDQLERYWATSCGNPRTYGGDLNLTITLFQRQVSNYFELVNNLRLLN